MKTKIKPLGPVTKTARGFQLIEFEDGNGVLCSLQQSSATDLEHTSGATFLWLGCVDANPRVLIPGQGWTSLEMPADYLADTRMHLAREKVASLITHLQKWLDKGKL